MSGNGLTLSLYEGRFRANGKTLPTRLRASLGVRSSDAKRFACVCVNVLVVGCFREKRG